MEAINIQKQRPEVFYKKDFIKKFAILTGKLVFQSLFNKVDFSTGASRENYKNFKNNHF